MPLLLWFTFIGSALLILLLGLPMGLGMVPPNAIYGVRLPITIRNRPAWDAANVHYGWWMVVSGGLSLGAFFLCVLLGCTVDTTAAVYVIVMMLPLMGGVPFSIHAAMKAEHVSDAASDGSSDDHSN